MEARFYVFDAYGTLFDVGAAVNRYKGEIGAHADTLSQLWRRKQLEYTWTLSLMGRWRDFRELTLAALDHAAEATGGLADGLRAKLSDAYETLDAYPDAVTALRALRDGGARTAILSNGSDAMLANATQAAGLDGLLDAVLSADAVRTFKPMPSVYGLVGQKFGCAPKEVTFVSSNRWDVAGAAAFGFATVWVNRSGAADEYTDLPPGQVVRDLTALLRRA